jgi:carboxypeptidase C (cathepsin A)
VAYTKDGVKDPAERPVTYSFNGGPGAAAVWVHFGAFGPKRVERDAEGMALPPPGRLVDNDLSLLDLTDLVFLDPVSTGYSRPAPGEDRKQFHGVDEDVASVGEVIRLWTTRNRRWASPKFLAGESYGTTRAAGLALYLDQRFGMTINGVILISSVLNWQNQEFNVGNDMPFILHLPSYTATAWYHKKLPADLAGDLKKAVAESEGFARNEYASALMQGDRLSPERARAVAEKVARLTGLSVDYVLRSNLRIELFRYLKELLRAEGKTVGRLDSRFTGYDLDSAGENPEFDPSMAATDASYASLANDYYRRVLGFESDLVYERLNRLVRPWSFADYANRYLNMAENLRGAMTRNPHLKVLVQSGYYDFATPYFDSVYTLDHLGLPQALRGNVRFELYQAGHMMYIRRADHEKFRKDVADFIRWAG